MSEETEMDLENVILADMHNISQAMKDHTPGELAEYARNARDPKVCSIRDRVRAGQPITPKQYWVLADYYVNHGECDTELAYDFGENPSYGVGDEGDD